MAIPIQNIYYLLCYAWNHWEEGQAVDVTQVRSPELADLFAHVLIEGTHHLLRRGMDRGYVRFSEDTSRLRGRLDFEESTRRLLFRNARAHCHFDELSHDVLHNQILKSTLRLLGMLSSLDENLRHQVAGIHRRLPEISDIRLTKQAFRRVQLHGNNAFYRFLLHVCELIRRDMFLDRITGDFQFLDLRDNKERMWKLFEDFVANFFRRERPDFNVKPQDSLKWDSRDLSDASQGFLPQMSLDLVMSRPDKAYVIDTKYYLNALTAGYHKETFHSAHLYQLFAYLKNIETRGGPFADAEGILLYPEVGTELRHRFTIQGHPIQIRTVDLSRPWQEIRASLLGMVSG